jgi:hypothetical protein
MPDIFINGRRYVPMAEAARKTNYTFNAIQYMVKQGHVAVHRQGRFTYVSLSDVTRWVANQQRKQTKLAQLHEWWRTHASERNDITGGADFYRRLQRDGIECSPALARTFLAKVKPRIWDNHQIMEWYKADPQRLMLKGREAVKQILADLKIEVNHTTLKKVRKAFANEYGVPFDVTAYMTFKGAAAYLGVSPSRVSQFARAKKLATKLYKDTKYILKSDVEHWHQQRIARSEVKA